MLCLSTGDEVVVPTYQTMLLYSSSEKIIDSLILLVAAGKIDGMRIILQQCFRWLRREPSDCSKFKVIYEIGDFR